MENVSVLYQPVAASAQANTAPSAKVYFKNLDGIRCLAALMVMFQHLSDYKVDMGIGFNAEKRFVENLGFYGVTLFFVLSGYLIFYLLFTEKKVTGTVSIKDFYIRRVLRIWPLYFGFGLLSILGIDIMLKLLNHPIHTPVLQNLFFLFTFSINIQMVFWPLNRGIIELYWSVCIEEQFYLFAPWLVKKGNRMLVIICSLIAIGIGSRFLLDYLDSHHIISFSKSLNPLGFYTTCWFDAFGLGILAAWLHFHKEIYGKIKQVVENRTLQAAVVAFTLLYVTNIIPRPAFISHYFFSTIPAILFAYIILSASTGNFVFNLEYPLMRRIGRYSYGMYVFHSAVAQLLLIGFVKVFSTKNALIYEGLYPLMVVVLVIVISGLSYELYEKKFLKIKKRFTLVQNQKV